MPLKLFLYLLIPIIFLSVFSHTRADLIDDLKGKIDERNQTIANLEKEIADYQNQIQKTGAEANTLKNKIASLELTRKKLLAETKVIQNKVAAANLTIQKLNGQISDAELTIVKTLDGISETLRQTNIAESASLAEILLNYPKMSDFLDRAQSLSELNDGLKSALVNLRNLKSNLQEKNTAVQGTKKQLVTLANDLSDKQKVTEYNKAQTAKILTATKNQQSEYQKILNQKIALKNAFEQELLNYESQLKFAIDPSNLPAVGSGVLKWPLTSVTITQYFGNTEFAKTHAQVYNGQGHNGIDFRAPIGTRVFASLSGVVDGVGDTDTVCPGASYGKWVLIRHQNGLSTLYAHFSVINVKAGDSVATGDVIGYSGETGYSTGPHLHFTVYATQGVKIMTRKSTVCKGSYTMPVASLNAYLNPLSYL